MNTSSKIIIYNLKSVQNIGSANETIENFQIRPKLFYSVLKDYIYNPYTGTGTAKFENIDAKIYRLDVSGLYAMTDNFSLDYGVAFQKGKKDEALLGKTDKDLLQELGKPDNKQSLNNTEQIWFYDKKGEDDYGNIYSYNFFLLENRVTKVEYMTSIKSTGDIRD